MKGPCSKVTCVQVQLHIQHSQPGTTITFGQCIGVTLIVSFSYTDSLVVFCKGDALCYMTNIQLTDILGPFFVI